ncbi:MAG: hypothetical protein M1819_002326 [Sarea resinae]|nr:MAG: hypothetical protein M1819_002326 [Sarea resinae]
MPPPQGSLEISSYLILPLTLPPLPSLPASKAQTITHHIYLRPHTPKIPTPSTSRTLFLTNLPIDTTEPHLRSLFANELGGARTEEVSFEGRRSTSKPAIAPPEASTTTLKKQKKRKRGTSSDDVDISEIDLDAEAPLPELWDRELRRSGSTAVVVFVDRTSMESALKNIRKIRKRGTRIVWSEKALGIEDKIPPLGSHRYSTHASLLHPSHTALFDATSTYLTLFTRLEAQRAAALALSRSVPDEDGFTTVTRGGRVGPARQEEALEKALQQKEKEERGRASRGDFYRFQIREKQKARAGELVRRFEEDRRKVEDMRRKRGKVRLE